MTTTDHLAARLSSLFANCSLVDLTLTLEERKPVSWPNATPFQFHPTNTYDDDGRVPIRGGPYMTHTLLLDEHTGTHFDAPSHFIPPPDSGLPHAGPAGLITGDKADLRTMMGPAAVIDCRELVGTQNGVSPIITVDHIQRDEEEHGPLSPGDVVLFHTAWDEQHFVDRHVSDAYVEEPFRLGTRPGWPAPDVPAAQYLHSRGVRFLATDGTSMGPVHDGAPVHWWSLANDMLFLEAGTNFGALPSRGAYFMFLPIKVAGSTGGAGRAIAFVPEAGS